MEKKRQELYEELKRRVGNTPLEPYKGDVANRNKIWIKRECDNPFGSHYDRVYIDLFRELEESGKINPGMNVLETTSGSAGVSFAGIGRILSYNCYIMIPDDIIKKKRIEAIKAQEGIILPTPSEEDIQGFTKERIIENIKKYNAVFFNHSRSLTALKSLESIAHEVISLIKNIDAYVVGVGNGLSIVGPGRVLRENNPNVQIIGYMPKQIGKSQYPGLMNQTGLSRPINFPYLKEAEKLMDRVELVNGSCLSNYHSDLGKTTRAGIDVALNLSKNEQEKDILVIGYDKAERY